VVSSEANIDTEPASTWCLVALSTVTDEHDSWIGLRNLVRDVDYSALVVAPTTVFYFFKNPAMATMFKLTFAGM
jgi:hypothetical protein